MVSCNTTLEDMDIEGHELKYSYGLTFHQAGLIVSATFALLSTAIALYLIVMHATHYTKPWEQKHIIRILFMIPVYSLVSFLSYYYYRHAIYFEVLRDCYEAFAIASFFTLLCHYVAPNLHEQKEFFRALRPLKNWILPLNWFQKCSGGVDKGLFRKPGSGLTWFNIIWISVFQYCFIRVLFTIVSVTSQSFNRYCEASLNPAFAHIWVLVFEGASVTVAMYGLIQFYHQLKEEIAEHRPFMKLLCIKLVIFFSFWQNLLISFLSSSSGPLQPSEHIAYPDIKVGIPSLLLTLEMTIFAVLHIFAFPWKQPYAIPKDASSTHPLYAHGTGFSGKPAYEGGRLGWRAIVSAFNPWDIIKASARGFRWLFVGVKHRRNDSSYQHTLGSGAPPPAFPGPHEYATPGTKLQPMAAPDSTAYGGPGGAEQPLYPHDMDAGTVYRPGHHLSPYPTAAAPAYQPAGGAGYPSHGLAPSHNGSDVWGDASVGGMSRTPSPGAPYPGGSDYFHTQQQQQQQTPYGQAGTSDDRRALLRDAAGPGVTSRVPEADVEFQQRQQLREQQSVGRMARSKESEASPVEVHPALRAGGQPQGRFGAAAPASQQSQQQQHQQQQQQHGQRHEDGGTSNWI